MAKLATLNECKTVYGIHDVYRMIEMSTVSDYNRALAQKAAADRST